MLERRLDRLDAAAVGRALLTGVLTWYVLDGVVSVAFGAYLNVASNTVYLALLGLPAAGLSRIAGGQVEARA
ncbi:MAG: hypothetical protein B7733_05620 [Myxococcales bacterium FL481]|nr:MAG: hypothetical protein B7733_05620 [Myxococcales bacterium FL481]